MSSKGFKNPFSASNRQGAWIYSFTRNNPPINIDAIINGILYQVMLRISQVGLFTPIYERVLSSILPQLGYNGSPPSANDCVLFFISYSLTSLLSKNNILESLPSNPSLKDIVDFCNSISEKTGSPLACGFFVVLRQLRKKFQGELLTLVEEIEAKILDVNPNIQFPPPYIMVEEILKIVKNFYNNP
jgi:hypothetical protein